MQPRTRDAWCMDPIPARAGVGLKPEHYEDILATKPGIGWFEIHPENYMGAGGAPHHYLTRVRSDYPISFHGVGLSIGSASRPSTDHLSRLSALMRRYEPAVFSEHLAWSSHESSYLNDLLPLPYTRETLALVCDHIDEIQSFLGMRMLLENPSTYVEFEASEMDEPSFLAEIARRTGCGLLLDVNNVYVSATNHQWSPGAYVDAFALSEVMEIHLGGHAETSDDRGQKLLIDAHDRTVVDDVWSLYRRVIARAGVRPTLIEWDNEVPEWLILLKEAVTADALLVASASAYA